MAPGVAPPHAVAADTAEEALGARHRLMVSDVLTDYTRKTEALLFLDVELEEAGSESDVFGEHPPDRVQIGRRFRFEYCGAFGSSMDVRSQTGLFV